MMSKKFQYNFTAQNELIELRDRIGQLQEENTLLKELLEQLIRVNTELTESIEEFNTDNTQLEYQQHQIEQMTHTIEILNNELEEVKKENQMLSRSPTQSKKLSQDSQETESLVGVLEELIESFKNMQARYDNQIQEFQEKIDVCKSQHQGMIMKMHQAYEQKLQTLDPILTQLARKQENLKEIQKRVAQLERRKDDTKVANPANNLNVYNPRKSKAFKDLEDKLQEKDKAIMFLQDTLAKLKAKFMQKL